MQKPERLLVLLLRLDAVILLGALLAVFLPSRWMVEVHGWLGLGDLPGIPIVGYLTRSLAALYALRGAVVLFLSFDVSRYAPLITFMAVTTIVFGLALVAIDVAAGMPWFWLLVEGPVIAAIWAAILWLQKEANERRGAR